MPLAVYRKKRRFEKTPEPKGRARRAPRTRRPLAYVIQKHDATRLHFDLRLELDGVMKSWAVPKGPSLNPAVKRMAVEVEDHPIEYNRFEGVIPKGEYGAGPVIIWDRGSWVPEEDPREGYRKGILKFRLEGEKLHGSWVLVRTRQSQRSRPAWLLIKHKDEAARPEAKMDIAQLLPRSVVSHRTIEEVGPSFHRRKAMEKRRPAKGKRTTQTPVIQIQFTAPEGARKAPLPISLTPQLATLVEKAPEGADWIHEIKLDGYRALCRISKGAARLFTRNGNDWTDRFDPIARAAAGLPVSEAWLDGEIVVLGEGGISSFGALQQALSEGRDEALRYYVFDLLYLDGLDLRRVPLSERKARLKALLQATGKAGGGRILYSDHIQGNGAAFYEKACETGLEGAIAKRASSPYVAGRGQDWLKVKCLQSRDLAVIGYTDPEGSRRGFGALVLGEAQNGTMALVGRVGTGFSERTLRDLAPRLKALEVDHPPVSPAPRGAAARGVHWVQPKLVADVAFTERTRDGILRHPTFRGLREDKSPVETAGESDGIELEQASAPPAPSGKPQRAAKRAMSSAAKMAMSGPRVMAKAGKSRRPAKTATARLDMAANVERSSPGRRARTSSKQTEGVDLPGGLRLTNPDKVLFPEDGVTKRQLVDYYRLVEERMMPYVKDRPLTIYRCPEGHHKFCFWEKHLDDPLPAGLRSISLDDAQTERERGGYFYAASLAGVLSLVQLGALELHVWGSRAAKVEYPDLMIFDVDPDLGLAWPRVVEGCLTLRLRLEKLGLQSWLKTTGGKGMHVCVPLGRRQNWDEVKEFSKALVESIAAEEPARYTTNPLKVRRRGKIFLDYLRNGRGATAVAAYSTRARAGVPVSMPMDWDELDTRLRSSQWTLKNAVKRMRLPDPWSEFYACRQSITAPMRRAVGMRAAAKR